MYGEIIEDFEYYRNDSHNWGEPMRLYKDLPQLNSILLNPIIVDTSMLQRNGPQC